MDISTLLYNIALVFFGASCTLIVQRISFVRKKQESPKDTVKISEIPIGELRDQYKDYLTVHDLLRHIRDKNVDINGKVLTQRVEDVYFEKRNWGVVKKEGEHWHQLNKWNHDIDTGRYLDRENFPGINPDNLKRATEEELEDSKEQYSPVFCAVNYKDGNLYLDLHY